MKRVVLVSAAVLLAACATTARRTAVATLGPTAGNTAQGTVTLAQNADGSTQVSVNLANVPPGVHGFHIHEKGDCGDNGNAAGGHFNPEATMHGSPDAMPHHAGDFGNVTADASGIVRTEFSTRSASLEEGASSAIGKAIILHANPDDLKTQPTGNAGGRIACGVITLQ